MKGVVRWRSKTQQDLINIFRYLASEAGLPTARKFLVQAEATFARLADMPHLGTRYEAENPLFGEIRFFPIRRFKNHLMFYLPTDQGIDVIRVLHGALDISSILFNDFGIDDAD